MVYNSGMTEHEQSIEANKPLWTWCANRTSCCSETLTFDPLNPLSLSERQAILFWFLRPQCMAADPGDTVVVLSTQVKVLLLYRSLLVMLPCLLNIQ